MEQTEVSAEEALNLFVGSFPAPERYLSYAKVLLNGIEANLAQIDLNLDQASQRWKVQRMSRIDRSILRLAAFEILVNPEATPTKVAINEAVELAKRYSGNEAPGFVNAILDSLGKG